MLLFSLPTSRKARLLLFPKGILEKPSAKHTLPLSKAQKSAFLLKSSIFSPFKRSSFFFHVVSAAGRVIVVSEETERSMKVTWRPAPGNVINYRVTYKPQSGGRQLAAKAPGGTTSTVLRRLIPLTTYDITVVPVYRAGEGKARQGEGRTCTLVYHSTHHKLLYRQC